MLACCCCAVGGVILWMKHKSTMWRERTWNEWMAQRVWMNKSRRRMSKGRVKVERQGACECIYERSENDTSCEPWRTLSLLLKNTRSGRGRRFMQAAIMANDCWWRWRRNAPFSCACYVTGTKCFLPRNLRFVGGDCEKILDCGLKVVKQII